MSKVNNGNQSKEEEESHETSWNDRKDDEGRWVLSEQEGGFVAVERHAEGKEAETIMVLQGGFEHWHAE